MLSWLKGRAELRKTSSELYERIVAQARTPSLYAELGVPDTMDGRLELILLHVVMVLDRMKLEGAKGQRLGQQLMERLVADMDDALRQLGLGDDSVSGRIQRLAGALSERSADYGMAFQASPTKRGAAAQDALETALLAHIYRPEGSVASALAIPMALRLADYVRRSRRHLEGTNAEKLLAGEVTFAPVQQGRDNEGPGRR